MHQPFEDDEPTLVPCPECDLNGASTHCDMCSGDQLVRAESRAVWRSEHPDAIPEQPCDRKDPHASTR